jgi:hypothetical protein
LTDFKAGRVDNARVQSDVAGNVVTHITENLRFYNTDVHTYLVDELGVLMFSHLVFTTNPAQRAMVETGVTTEEFRLVYDLSAQWVFHHIEKHMSPTLFSDGFRPREPIIGDMAHRPSFQGLPLDQNASEERRLRMQRRVGLLVDSDESAESSTDEEEQDKERARRFRRIKKNTQTKSKK